MLTPAQIILALARASPFCIRLAGNMENGDSQTVQSKYFSELDLPLVCDVFLRVLKASAVPGAKYGFEGRGLGADLGHSETPGHPEPPAAPAAVWDSRPGDGWKELGRGDSMSRARFGFSGVILYCSSGKVTCAIPAPCLGLSARLNLLGERHKPQELIN